MKAYNGDIEAGRLKLTIDNSSLSLPNSCAGISGVEPQGDAISCNLDQVGSPSLQLIAADVGPDVSRYLQASLAENTKKAYLSDMAAFARWGGEIPSSVEVIGDYLVQHARMLSPLTLRRKVVALGKAHVAQGYADPTKNELIRGLLRGICRVHGVPQAQASALRRDDLMLLVDALPDTLIGARDRALILIGFAGGFRRSELVGLNVEDVSFESEGVLITLRRSKTDQVGHGRNLGIPYGRTRACPVKALQGWLQQSAIGIGPIFRSVSKGSEISHDALSAQSVNLVLAKCAERAGLNCVGLSAHSLRSGLVTAAAKAGVSSWKIRRQTGHKSDAMLNRYIRDADIFADNASGAVL